MQHIGNFTLFAILLFNVIGLTLLTGMWLRNAWVALTSGPLLLCTVLFGVECYKGLGDVSWLLPITTAISAFLIYEVEAEKGMLMRWGEQLAIPRWKAALSYTRNPSPYVVFILTFAYCMSWRYLHPNIDRGTELIADLSNICAYLSGQRIPVPDFWFPPLASNHYYSFQYYGAGLLGRLFQLNPGTTYNVSYGLLCSLALTTGMGVIWAMAEKWWVRVLVSLHLVFGGTGVTGFLYLLRHDGGPYPWDFMRFMGNPTWNTTLGAYVGGYDLAVSNQNLPGESLAYSIFLGDYHPVLSGFYVMAYGLLVAILWVRLRVPSLLFLLGATIPWVILCDTWNLPLTGIAIALFLVNYARTLYLEGSWKAFVLGGSTCVFALFPYFRLFAASSEDFATKLRPVPWDRHSPLILFVLFFLPTIAFIMGSLVSGRRVLVLSGALMGCLFAFSELFYLNDSYSGIFDRFNSTLKWWPLVTEATLLTLVPMLLEMKLDRPFLKVAMIFFACYPITFGYELFKEYIGFSDEGWTFVGRLRGSDYLTSEITPWESECVKMGQPIVVSNETLFLEYLSTLPKNYVLVEHPEGESFNRGSAMTLFSNHRCFMGWIGHENLWRGGANAIRYRYDTVEKIYKGEVPNAGEWLASQGADGVLWFKNDLDKDTLWEKVDATLKSRYHWHDFITEGNNHHIGFWEKNSNP